MFEHLEFFLLEWNYLFIWQLAKQSKRLRVYLLTNSFRKYSLVWNSLHTKLSNEMTGFAMQNTGK